VKIRRVALDACADAGGLVVSIDVLRAFTTAAYLFDAGVRDILLVSGVEDAFTLRDQLPGSLILGEVDGIQVPGFDLGNSPSALAGLDLRGRRIIQRTTAGTQGVVRAVRADILLAAGLTNASATVRCIQRLAPQEVTLVLTGYHPEEGWGDEDAACADMIEAGLLGKPVELGELAQKVRQSRSGGYYDGKHPSFPPADLELALAFDRFDFAMRVERGKNLFILRKDCG
jgi:2-phosphosulfolactate phosphatase